MLRGGTESEASEDGSSLESPEQIAVVLNHPTTNPPPLLHPPLHPSPPASPPPPQPPAAPASPAPAAARCALISRHFESFSRCIFYHFFLRLALSYASAPLKIQSQKNKTTRSLDSLSLALSLSVCLSRPIVNRRIGKSALNRRISHCIRRMHLFTPVNILSILLGNQTL